MTTRTLHAVTLVRQGRTCMLDATTRGMAEAVLAATDGMPRDELVHLVHRLAWLAGLMAVTDPEDVPRVLNDYPSAFEGAHDE